MRLNTQRDLYGCFENMTDEEIVIDAKENENTIALEYLINKYRNFVRAKARSYFLIGADREDVGPIAARIRIIKRTAGHGITCVLLPDFRAMSAVLVKPPADTAMPADQGPTDAKNASFRLICRDIIPGLRLWECAPDRNKKGAHLQPR